MTTQDALSASGAQIAQAAAQFQWDGHSLEAGIGISASGGGFRAMLFHAGALLRLSQLRRVLDVTDNQVRALRRRDLIDRLIKGNKIADEAELVAAQAHGRMGAWARTGVLTQTPASSIRLALFRAIQRPRTNSPISERG
jgi:hypothetical protein